MARYFITISYLGMDFNGWQIQKNTPNTVQQKMEETMSIILNEKIELLGCGRTDTGVNARNFVAHFDSHKNDLSQRREHWGYKFNTLLPKGIAVTGIRKVKDEAHARFDALQRDYIYYISRKRDPFRDPFSWFLHGELDFQNMNKAAKVLSEYKDFSSFSKSNTQNKTNICNIFRAQWQPASAEVWKFQVSADRFLRGMVRAMVGTMVMVGQGKLSVEDVRKIILSKDRQKAGSNAPPQGLFFTGIHYREDIYND